MAKRFRTCSAQQPYLLPPSLEDWLPESHLARFVADVVSELDLSGLLRQYGRQDGRGLAAYHPEMMTRLLLYAYCTGQPSSRKIEQATYTDLAYRYLAVNQHPDHDTIASFRQRHLQALAALFLQVLRLCQQAGLVKLGHVAIDGTKTQANASRQQSYTRDKLIEQEKRWQETVDSLLQKAQATDRAEAARPETESLPQELQRAATRLAALRQAQHALEQQARQNQQQAEADYAASARPAGRPRKGQERSEAERAQHAKHKRARTRARARVKQSMAQRNVVDPDSRLMVGGSTQSVLQAYNAQAAVDDTAHVIVACDLTSDENDRHQLRPMVEQTKANTGRQPTCITADAGYWDTMAIEQLQAGGQELLVPPERRVDKPSPRCSPQNAVAHAMRERLRSEEGKKQYRKRGGTVETVFAHTKQQRGLRQFLLRGRPQVRAEWALLCLTHNLLRLFRLKPVPKGQQQPPHGPAEGSPVRRRRTRALTDARM